VNQVVCFWRQTEGKATAEAAFQMEDLAREYGKNNILTKAQLFTLITFRLLYI
jgi:hypothetical protein